MNDGHKVAKFVLYLVNVEMLRSDVKHGSNNGMHCAILKTDDFF